jgi:hypothetical protein
VRASRAGPVVRWAVLATRVVRVHTDSETLARAPPSPLQRSRTRVIMRAVLLLSAASMAACFSVPTHPRCAPLDFRRFSAPAATLRASLPP